MKRKAKTSYLVLFECAALCVVVLALGALPATVYSATQANQLSQFGITWKFNGNYTFGQFANGDYYVVGPVVITSITPASVDISGRIKNGSMINPSPVVDKQGYDNAMSSNTYDSAFNKAFNVSANNPLVVQPGSSLVSAISIEMAEATPQLETAAILTVLGSEPAAGSFRPPYSGTDKTIRYNKSQLQYSLLKKLPPVAATPTLTAVEQQFERPWLDHKGFWSGRYQHPADNMPNYGREMATAIGDGALMLHLDFTDLQKEKLLIRYVQLGIDLYGIVEAGGVHNWEPDGGHGAGRKWPIMFAGLMLGDGEMASIGSIPFSELYFGEDGQTFYVSQADVDLADTITNWEGTLYYGHFYPAGPKDYQEYIAADIGLPEWGIRHATYPLYDGKDWNNAAYRECCTANAWGGFVLAALMMDQKTTWNHDALFDYMDRYMSLETKGTFNRQQSRFAENMWDVYKDGTHFSTAVNLKSYAAFAAQWGQNQASKVIYQTDFSDGLPAGWSVIDNRMDEKTWMSSNIDDLARPSPYLTGMFMIVYNWWIAGVNPIGEQLITGSINCSDFQQVTLSFNHDFDNDNFRGIGNVDISANGGEWQNMANYQSSDAGLVQLDISIIAARCPDVRVRWYYSSESYFGYWGIDDVKLESIPLSSQIPSNYDRNAIVDLYDFAAIASAWGTVEGDENWNPACDKSLPADHLINMRDFDLFRRSWLETTVEPLHSDFNQDGKVDFADLSILAGNWLEGVTP